MIGFAGWEMRRELSHLWQECFDDPKRTPDFFLNNIFSPRDCLVARMNGRLAAAVYLLPARVFTGGQTVQAHYIFAAGTALRFRSHGYMSSLLAYAALAGAERGDAFSAVLPSEESLYRYYADAGYADFFEARTVELSDVSLRAMAFPAAARGRLLPDAGALNRLRTEALVGNVGSLLWDDRMFRLSAAMSHVYGDRLVCAGESGGSAYALCHTEGEECIVLEAFAAAGAFPALAAAILRETPAKRYRFRLPVGSGLLPGEGICARLGMMKAIGGKTLADARPEHPYIGLAME